MILADIILISIGLSALFVATLTDFKKKEVPDWLSFSTIAAGLGVRLIYSVYSSDYLYFLYGLLGFAAMSVLGIILYYGRLWGGGDTKLLMGLGVLFGTGPYFLQMKYPFLMILLINIILIGSVYSLLFAVYLFFVNRHKTVQEIKNQASRVAPARSLYMLASFIFIIMSFFLQSKVFKLLSLSLAVFFLAYIHLLIFIRAVERSAMYKIVSVSQLTEGDWLAKDIIIKGKLIYSKNSLGIEKRQIEKLRSLGIKRVLIKDGIAFVPSFLMGLIATLLFGAFIF